MTRHLAKRKDEIWSMSGLSLEFEEDVSMMSKHDDVSVSRRETDHCILHSLRYRLMEKKRCFALKYHLEGPKDLEV